MLELLVPHAGVPSAFVGLCRSLQKLCVPGGVSLRGGAPYLLMWCFGVVGGKSYVVIVNAGVCCFTWLVFRVPSYANGCV